MAVILQARLDPAQALAAADTIPRVRPVTGPWLTVDDAYAAQVALKARLLTERPGAVLAEASEHAAGALSRALLAAMAAQPAFGVDGSAVRCPDGALRTIRPGRVLHDAGHILQEDLCLLQRRAGGHVLIAAALCFPASWTLAEKLGKPLLAIHDPVDEYDEGIAARVDRLLAGVREAQPLWRANLLRYADAALHQPRTEADPRPVGRRDSPFLRSERQTILRVAPDLVLFAIHTTVVAA